MMLDITTLPGTCGAAVFHNFNGYGSELNVKYSYPGGANLAVAGFIDTPDCRWAYTELKNRFNIVYQSSVRRNGGSGNMFFFVVYDGKRN